MSLQKVLLVEDEENLREIIRLNLEMEGVQVIEAADGSGGLRTVMQQELDLVILDVMLPFVNGLDVCAQIKQVKPQLPVLMISARGESRDRVAGLRAGADDYLAKPFDLEELVIRVTRLLERGTARKVSESRRFRFAGFMVDLTAFEVLRDGKVIHRLNRKEALILELLLSRAGQVVSREEIMEAIWEPDSTPTARAVDNYLVALRKMVGDDSRNPTYFLSVRGVGYQFNGKII
jgi:two-component system alkaline phosphatase synthesis response regulator PhoP